jgi:hypothetical protein
MNGRSLGFLAVLATAALAPSAYGQAPDLTVPAARDADPVILTGKDLGAWATPANQTAKLPLMDLFQGDCQVPGVAGDCEHNHYSDPDVDTATLAAPEGTPADRLLGYRWDTKRERFEQIPFQVDEQFTRYLDNSASGFAAYSGQDEHTTYAFDREGFRWTQSSADDPCVAEPTSPVATDPVKGLDHNDEVAFMARDAGPRAPSGALLPAGTDGLKEVRLLDPTNPAKAVQGYVYILRATAGGPKPAFDASNGYVSYKRDKNANTFEKSESSYDNYGNAAEGIYCDAEGNVVLDPKTGKPAIAKRRPRDTAWVQTDRYKYRYDGRWLMTQIRVSEDGDKGKKYGADLVDRWKARAFAQDPGSETPCCGYEEEDTNWGGSSTLLGERVGPVRAIRETWGADSGTNVVRRESFYRDTMRQKTWLRVHVIPPLDGIYAQWDFNAGKVDRFYNSRNAKGVPVDGVNDEMFGNFDDPCNERFDGNSTSAFDQTFRSTYRTLGVCELSEYHQSVDPGDPTFADANAALGWSQISGPNGTIVDRITTNPGEMPAGGAAQSLTAVPYYRDDACFDDGTGSNPGPKLNLRSGNETDTAPDGTKRKCWTPADGDPGDDPRFYQGSIGTHGVHLLFLVDSDNARQQKPLTEIINEWNMVMLPGDPGNVGETYGRSLEKPLVAAPTDAGASLPARKRKGKRARARLVRHAAKHRAAAKRGR